MFWFLACSSPAPAPVLADTPLPFKLQKVADHPVVTAISVAPAGPEEPYLAEQVGRVWKVGATSPLLDIRARVNAGGEMGLLGLAFSPRWPEDPRIFVNYTYKVGAQLRTRVSSFRTDVRGETADPASEVEVLTFDQPWENHNSGGLTFGPDGKLYITVGDGGSGGDPKGTGQRTDDWLGSILRVDVNTPPYTVPADNPFVGKEGFKPEIWAYGVRNPWGAHFDGGTLWFADVGQNDYEEINKGVAGGNYGWNVMEASHCFKLPICASSSYVAPVAEYSHAEGNSVTGGLVYRGPSIPGLDGRYLYADFVTGKLWTLPTDGGAPTLFTRWKVQATTFGSDRAGRLYVADLAGSIYRVDP